MENLDANFGFKKSYEFPLDEYKTVGDFHSKLSTELNNSFEENELFEASYKIKLKDNLILLTDLSFVENKTDTNLQGKSSIPISSGSCPSGMVEYKTCYSASCGEDAVKELASNMKNGDEIYVRRNLTSATICGNKSLVDRTLNNQQ